MIQIIIIICLAILSLILIGVILYILISESYSFKIKKVKKQVKQVQKELLNKINREIDEQKLNFKQQINQERYQLNLDLKQLKSEKEILKKNEMSLDYQQKCLDNSVKILEKRNQEYDIKMKNLMDNLYKVSGLDQNEAKVLLLKQIKKQINKEMSAYVKNVELETIVNSKNIANSIIIDAMERYVTNVVNEKTTNILKLPNEEIKGRIIGREGRNLKAFEQLSGVDILIDETPRVITISCFNPIRREIATKALQKLINDGRIQPVKIEAELKRQEESIDSIILETGSKVVQELGISDMELPLIKLIGKLKYRTSYGQNVLLHSMEVAKIAGSMASELGINVNQAIRAGLLHDIGKAMDFEEEGSHVVLGANVARKYNEDEIIVNAIESHHEDVPKNSFIACLVAIADTISASRPSARNNSADEFFKRMQNIENLANEIVGVDKIYAFQSGRQIRVIVNPNLVDDQDLENLIDQLKKKILKTVLIPGEILITIIRERRLTQVIKK